MRIAKKITGMLTAMVCAAGTVCGGGFFELTDKLSLVNEPLTAEAYSGTRYENFY